MIVVCYRSDNPPNKGDKLNFVEAYSSKAWLGSHYPRDHSQSLTSFTLHRRDPMYCSTLPQTSKAGRTFNSSNGSFSDQTQIWFSERREAQVMHCMQRVRTLGILFPFKLIPVDGWTCESERRILSSLSPVARVDVLYLWRCVDRGRLLCYSNQYNKPLTAMTFRVPRERTLSKSRNIFCQVRFLFPCNPGQTHRPASAQMRSCTTTYVPHLL